MKSSAFYAVLGIGIIIVVGIVWWASWSHMAKPIPQGETETSTSTQNSLSGMSIYTNGEYGFTLFYPAQDVATTTFAQYYHLPNSWRFGALPNATGTPVIAIVGYRTESDNSYPRYFDAEVRVGATQNVKEINSCAQVGDGELPKGDVTINGTTWHVFGFQSAGMMQYVEGVSYRTVHEGTCIALESIKAGSNYHDDAPSSKDIADSVLDQQYANLTAIVQSFSFVKP